MSCSLNRSFLKILLLSCLAFVLPESLCAQSSGDDVEFEIVSGPKKTVSATEKRSNVRRRTRRGKTRPRRKALQGAAPLRENAVSAVVDVTQTQSDDVEFEIVSRPKPAAVDLGLKHITDDPDLEIVRTRGVKKDPKEQQSESMSRYEKEKKAYEAFKEEKMRSRKFLFYSYIPWENTINGIDARLFFTGMVVSLFYVVAMILLLIRELGSLPAVYSVQQMKELRAQGYAPVTEKEASMIVRNLWDSAAGGKILKKDELLTVTCRSELNILHSELSVAASAVPTDPDSVEKLNRISDSVNFWRTRYLVAPWINSDSGWFKRIIMGILYCGLVFYLYPRHPMFLLVIFCPLAFWTPAYLVEDRENSRIYRLLGGSLKIFGKMTSSALDTVATGEGSTVTVWKDSWGNTRHVEYNCWGTVILFGIKIAAAFFFLYLVLTLAPLIVLYGLIRNYILAR